MTELEKPLPGLLYDANSDPALLEARAADQRSVHGYNALRSSQKEEKNALSAYHFRVPVRPISSLSRRFLLITAAIRVSAVHLCQP